MAHQIGLNRLIYKSKFFATGKTVTVDLWSPALIKDAGLALTELNEGIYYLDYVFSELGGYFGKFYEDGVGAATHVYSIVSAPGQSISAPSA